MRSKFWMVWNPNGRAPTHKHTSRRSAVAESERLARLVPGDEFHVLESVGTARKRDVDWEPHTDNDPDKWRLEETGGDNEF